MGRRVVPNSRDISFATFNLYNLNLPGQPIYDNETGWSADDYKVKVAWIARQLQTLDADVIGFQECWDPKALLACFKAAKLDDEYDIVARKPPSPGIQVALAARKGLLTGEPLWIEEFPENARFVDLRERRDAKETVTVTIRKFSRPPLRVTIQPKGSKPKPPPITIYVAHLKSKGPATLSFKPPKAAVLEAYPSIAQSVVSHVRRIVEAGALRAILNDDMKGNEKPVVVIGDLNDGTLATSTELLTGQPGYRFIEASKAGSKSDAGLYSVEKLQQLRSFRDVYFTHIFQQNMESLDHILVSDAFYDHAISRKWSFNETVVLNDHLALESAEDRTAMGASDHGQVRAKFDWNPMRKALETPDP
ncbi:MAG: endonuclease/exonuclease/phosphatase family protein [Hyphomicrobiales bacterium]|nr:MAG: endonuclease/exonuclease/phosphatase family protein [Hyphomicrobiales bacterium]